MAKERRKNQFLLDYTSVPHLRNPPTNEAIPTALRDARRAAVLTHAGALFANTEEGRPLHSLVAKRIRRVALPRPRRGLQLLRTGARRVWPRRA